MPLNTYERERQEQTYKCTKGTFFCKFCTHYSFFEHFHIHSLIQCEEKDRLCHKVQK